MAKVLLTGIEASIATCLKRALAIEKHKIELRPYTSPIDYFLDADIVFAGGDARQYLPLLRGVRRARPALPFIVVTKIADTSEWLRALEAGATDYCAVPIQARQINWIMESAIRRAHTVPA